MKILFAKKDAAIAILSALIVALVNWIVMRPEASAMRAWTKATESPSAEASAEPTVTLASQLSPNGKSLIESYGRITNVKAGGMYSAEGIRLLDVDTGQSIWTMEPRYYQQHF
jgi:hypothetical protein